MILNATEDIVAIESVGVNVGVNVGVKLSQVQQQILSQIRSDPGVTIQQLATILGKSARTIERHIRILRENKLIKRTGSHKSGHWQLLINHNPGAE